MKSIRKFLLGLLVAVATMLTSCGGNEPDMPDVPASDTYQSVTVIYYINLSNDCYSFYDVKVIYTNGSGEAVQGSITNNQNFAYTIPVAKLPEDIRFALQLTAKSPLPSVDTDRAFIFSNSSSVDIVGNKNDGTKITRNIDTQYFEFEVLPEDVPDFVSQEPEMLIGPYEYPTVEFKRK